MHYFVGVLSVLSVEILGETLAVLVFLLLADVHRNHQHSHHCRLHLLRCRHVLLLYSAINCEFELIACLVDMAFPMLFRAVMKEGDTKENEQTGTSRTYLVLFTYCYLKVFLGIRIIKRICGSIITIGINI